MTSSPRSAVRIRSVLFAGGRSGGHVFPALAVAEELLDRGFEVGFVGTESGLEARVVRSRQLPFFHLPAAPLVGRGLVARLRALALLLVSSLRAWHLVRRIAPGLVFGTGGYVSAPTVLGGFLARRRIFLLEPNADAGTANRWLSRVAHGAAVAFESTRRQLHCPSWLTGVPVRRDFFAAGPVRGAAPTLLVLGGSQGAQHLNRILPETVVRLLAAVPELRVLHQCGTGHEEATRAAYRSAGDEYAGASLDVEVLPFLDDVAAAMARAHLVLSRAGAITLAEICAAGRASVLVPLPLAGAHQERNAVRLAEAGAAVVLLQSNLDVEPLRRCLADLLVVPERLAEMGAAARSLARPDAGVAIADRVENLLSVRRFSVGDARGGA